MQRMFPTQYSIYIKMIKCITLSLSECTLSALVKLPTEHNYLLTAGASLRRHLFELLFFFFHFFFYVWCFVPEYKRGALRAVVL